MNQNEKNVVVIRCPKCDEIMACICMDGAPYGIHAMVSAMQESNSVEKVERVSLAAARLLPFGHAGDCEARDDKPVPGSVNAMLADILATANSKTIVDENGMVLLRPTCVKIPDGSLKDLPDGEYQLPYVETELKRGMFTDMNGNEIELRPDWPKGIFSKPPLGVVEGIGTNVVDAVSWSEVKTPASFSSLLNAVIERLRLERDRSSKTISGARLKADLPSELFDPADSREDWINVALSFLIHKGILNMSTVFLSPWEREFPFALDESKIPAGLFVAPVDFRPIAASQ